MKAYTDLEQSKKLAKILPIESADMAYMAIIEDYMYPQKVKEYRLTIKDECFNSKYDIPAWSLAALLEVIHKDFYIVLDHDGVAWTCKVRQHDHRDIKDGYWGGDPVDVCAELIIKLKEKGLI